MFGIGMPELIVILIIALVVIGPRKLPELASALGKGYGEFQRALKNMRDTVENVDNDVNHDLDSLPSDKSPDIPQKEDKEPGNK